VDFLFFFELGKYLLTGRQISDVDLNNSKPVHLPYIFSVHGKSEQALGVLLKLLKK